MKPETHTLAGFSLLEMIFSLAILLVVTGVVFGQIILMQRKSAAEGSKVDSTQQAREFVDQMVRDLHLAGYPKASMYSAALDNTSPQVAAGLVSVSPTQIVLEGDVNSEGVVYSVRISYVANDPNDPRCPCIRRTATPKIPGDPLAQPVSPSYSEIDHVMPPGTGAGGSGEDLFTFFDENGNPVDLSTGNDISTPQGQQNLKTALQTIKINVSLLNSSVAAGSGETTRTSLTGTARIEQ